MSHSLDHAHSRFADQTLHGWIACLIASMVLATASMTAFDAEAATMRLAPTVVLDVQGFGRPIAAASLFVPYGWQAEGGVAWGDAHACTNGYGTNWSAGTPDGQHGIAILPHQGWEWSQSGSMNPSCQMLQIGNAEQYLRAIIGHTLPKARITSVQRRADLEMNEAQYAGVQDNGFQRIETSVSSAQAFVDYEHEGVPLRGSFVVSVLMTYIRTGSSGDFGPPIESWTGYASPMFASFGPAQEYNANTYEGIRKSYLVNPVWQQQINQHNRKMGQIAAQGARERAQIWAKANAEISQIINDTWRNQQQSADYRARETLEAIMDVETYSDSSAPGGQVQLSNMYDQAWKLDDGTYVLTSDPSFNPYQSFGIDGQQLSAAPR